jgi:hypothetical protein
MRKVNFGKTVWIVSTCETSQTEGKNGYFRCFILNDGQIVKQSLLRTQLQLFS